MNTDGQTFWNKHAKSYAVKPIKDMHAYEKKLERTRHYLTSKSCVLELGCGSGMTALSHSEHAGYVIATDYSQQMIEIARRRVTEKQQTNIRFIQQDAVSACSIGSFDMVLALNLIHLLDNRGNLLEEIYKTVKPGGIFVSSTHCFADRTPYLIYFFNAISKIFRKIPYIHVFSASQWVDELTTAGFKILESWRSPSDKSMFIVCQKPSM